MTDLAALPYDRAAQQVEDLMVQGTPFAQVEKAIDTADAPQEHRFALWLLAWSLRAPSPRSGDVRRRHGAPTHLGLNAP